MACQLLDIDVEARYVVVVLGDHLLERDSGRTHKTLYSLAMLEIINHLVYRRAGTPLRVDGIKDQELDNILWSEICEISICPDGASRFEEGLRRWILFLGAGPE